MNTRPRLGELRRSLVEVAKEHTGLGFGAANRLVAALLGTIVTHVASHDVTELRGLGSFRWVVHKARKFKGGLFGATTVPEYRHLTFRSKAMKGLKK